MMSDLAHPLVQSGGLGLPPVVIVALALALVAGAAVFASRDPQDLLLESPHVVEDGLRGRGRVWRALGVGLLALVLLTGRLGVDRYTDNLAPALALGVGWPLGVALSAALGQVWRRLDPFDSLARLVRAPSVPPPARADVRWALPAGMVLTWYWAAYPQALRPGAVGAATALYTIYAVAGCALVGRRRWLEQAEPIGLFLGWVGRIRRSGLVAWHVPVGAHLLLGVFAGGLLFPVLRLPELTAPLWFRLPAPEVIATLLLMLLGMGFLHLLAYGANRLGDGGMVAAVAVPVVAALAVAVGLPRAVFSAQVLASRVSDPFGYGWDLFGTASLAVRPDLLGDTGLLGVQVGLLVLGGIVGARVAAGRSQLGDRRFARFRRDFGVAGGGVILSVAILALTVA